MIVKSVTSALTMASVVSCSLLDMGGLFKRATLPDSFYGTVSSSIVPYNGELSAVESFYGNTAAGTAASTAQTTSSAVIATISSQVTSASPSTSTIIWWTPETTSTTPSTSSIVWWTPESASTSTSSVVNLWAQSSSASSAQTTSKSSSVSIAPYTANLTQFYLDYFSSRYYYVNQYATFFQTHVFSDVGTEVTKLSNFLTYTDGSYTTLLSNDAQLTSALSNAATQFPWYTQWYQVQAAAYEATATGSQVSAQASSSSASVSFGGSMEKDKMRLLTLQIGAIVAALVYLFVF